MRIKSVILVALSVTCLTLTGCDLGGVWGNGHVVTEARSIGPFSNVDARGAFEIEWHSGAPSVVVTADENLQQYIEVTTHDNTLRLRTTHSIRFSRSMKVDITSERLEAAELSGACRLIAHRVNGAGFYVESTGATKVTVDGVVNELIASMTGASNLSAAALQTKSAQVSVTGAGRAAIAVSDSLKASITGAGRVEYSGNPAHIEREVSGAGSIRRIGGGGPAVIGRSHD